MKRSEPDCAHCKRRPHGYVTDPDSLDAFPDTWSPLSGHPGLRPAPWLARGRGSRWVFCEACRTVWFLFFNPKDLYYSEMLPVAEAFWPVLEATSELEDVLAAILDQPRITGGRFFEDWIVSWLRRAEFERAPALEWLLTEMDWEHLSAEDARLLVSYVGAIIDRPDAPGGLQVVDFGPLARLAHRTDIFERLDSHKRGWAEKKLREALESVLKAAGRRSISLGGEVEFRIREATSPRRLIYRVLAKLAEAFEGGNDPRLAEVMNREYLSLQDSLVDEEGTVDIRHLRPVLAALTRLRQSAAASLNPHRPIPRAVARYDYLLNDLVERGQVARADIVEVLDVYAPHRVSYFRPDDFDTARTPTTVGCHTCRTVSPPKKVTKYVDFPRQWSNIYDLPNHIPGGWVGTMQPEWVHYCANCHAFWYTYVSADGASYVHEPLPQSCATALDTKTTAAEMVAFVASPVYAAHRLVAARRLCWRYFEQSYGAREGVGPLFGALNAEALSDDQCLDLLRFIDLTLRVLEDWKQNYSGKSIDLPNDWPRALDTLTGRNWRAPAAAASAETLALAIRARAERYVTAGA